MLASKLVRAFALALLVPAARAQLPCSWGRLTDANPQPDALVGSALATAGDLLAVGSPFRTGAGDKSCGAVLCYERAESGWAQAAVLEDPAPEAFSQFGIALAMSADTLVVGAPFHDVGALGNQGKVYVYTRQAGAWLLQQELSALDGGDQQLFGWSLALEGDRLAIGALWDGQIAHAAGAAYVFDRVQGVWSQTAKLVAPDQTILCNFGASLALSGDRVLIGAPDANTIVADAGAVYVFELEAGVWTQKAKFWPSDTTKNDEFGSAVVLAGDAAFVSAPSDDFANKLDIGSVYRYALESHAWVAKAKYFASDNFREDYFGTRLALSGTRLLIGAPGKDSGFTSNVGEAYLFEQGASEWSEVAKFKDTGNSSYDELGRGLAISAQSMFVGSPQRDTAAENGGSVLAWEFEAAQALFACPTTVSLSAGGSVGFELAAGSAQAGQLYLLLGSFSGTQPGTPVGSALFPLNPDALTFAMLAGLNSPPHAGNFGLLGATGGAQASLTVPPASDPALAGLTVHHAYLAFDAAAGIETAFCSNSVFTKILP